MSVVEVEAVDVLVSVWDPATESYVSQSWLDAPAWVDAHNVQAFLTSRFGPPIDVAVDTLDDLGVMPVGWWYPVPDDLRPDVECVGCELFAVPQVIHRDESVEPLYPYLARQAAFVPPSTT
jgi:hypothetical protein